MIPIENFRRSPLAIADDVPNPSPSPKQVIGEASGWWLTPLYQGIVV